MENRFARHEQIAAEFREAMEYFSLKMLPTSEGHAANTLSAPLYPAGVEAAAFMKAMGSTGVIVAGGLLPERKNDYFRVGHMGAVNKNDLVATISAIETALGECGYYI